MAVATVEDGIKRLGMLQDYLYRAHRAALGSFQAARHHSLEGRDLHLVEAGMRKLAQHLDWPAALGERTPQEDLDRPLTDGEAGGITRWASSAFTIAGEMLDLSALLDDWYGDLVRWAAEAARSAALRVTVWQHRKAAGKLIFRLDQLCADERIAGALAAARRKDALTAPGGERWFAGETLPEGYQEEGDDDDEVTRLMNRRLLH
jgi:hypothetical protein